MKKENKLNAFNMNYAFLAATLTLLAFILIFFFVERMPGQKWIVLRSDLRILYIAFSKLFWGSLLGGEGIQYTFHVSLGMSSIPLYTYYSLSPFNILYLLIDHEELASVVLVVLKLSLSAYTFQRFSAKVLKNDSLSSVAFAVGYALSGYCIVYYYNILFLDGVYMLPVIALLISEAVKDHRFTKLTFAYAYLFVVQFYEGYIIGFYSLLFFVLLMITEYKKEWKKYISAMIRFSISVIIAALIGAAFLYPTAVYLLSDFGNIITSDWALECNILDIYKNLFIGQYQTMESPYPYIYCGIIALYLVPCFFAERRISKGYRLTALAALAYLLLCSLWLPGYKFMHCFDVPDGNGFRFSYFYPFILLAICCAEWKYMASQKIWKLILLCVVQMLCYLLLGFGENNNTLLWEKVSNIVFLLIFFFFFIMNHKLGSSKIFQGVLLGIVYIELIVNGILVGTKFEAGWTDVRDSYQAFMLGNNRAIDEIKSQDHEFYRIINKNPYDLNDSALHDYYGMTYFSTMVNVDLKETLGRLGYAVSPRIDSDNGGTPLTEMFFSGKYEIVVNSADYILGRTDALWSVNDRTLSLGYMVSDEILNTVLDSDIAFENQNSIASGMIGENVRVFTPYTGRIIATTTNMSVIWNGESYGLVPDDEMTESSLVFRLEDEASFPVYAYFAQEESRLYFDSVYFVSGEGDRFNLMGTSIISLPQIIELSRDDEGKYFVGLYYDAQHSNKNYYKESYFYCYDDAVVDKVYEALKDNQMNILEMHGSDIMAEIEVPEDKPILFTSIPYDEGWHILVDGKEAETLAVVDDTFLAVELTEGHHELKFYYDSAVNRTGAIFSICGILLWVVLLFIEKRNIHKSAAKEHNEV